MRRWRVGPRVAWTHSRTIAADQEILCWAVTVLPSGPPVVLQDTSALIWDALLEHEGETELIEAAAAAAGVSPDDVRTDVRDFLASLEGLGLVQSEPGESDPSSPSR